MIIRDKILKDFFPTLKWSNDICVGTEASKQMSGNLGGGEKIIILIMISVLRLSSPQEQDLWGVDWGVCVAQAGADWQLLHTR